MIMDYEKKYKEALERARQFSEHPLQEDSDSIVEYIFPELKESEDERIRKEIVRFIQMEVEDEIVGNKWLAWLGKQGEQKPAEWSEEDEQHVNSLLKRLEGMCKKGATYTATRFAVSQDIDWLKSLKERKGGKI